MFGEGWVDASAVGGGVCVVRVEGGRGTLGTNDFGLQLKGTKWRGKGAVGRRGTIEPFARRKSVRPVRSSGSIHTPSSALDSAFAAVWLALARAWRLSVC